MLGSIAPLVQATADLAMTLLDRIALLRLAVGARRPLSQV
jgi:hypothetical protein